MSDETRQRLANEIAKRIADHSAYLADDAVPERGDIDSDISAEVYWQARAVAALFQTADPEASSAVAGIDLGAELVAAAGELRNAAEVVVDDGLPLRAGGADANRLGFLANIVENTEELVRNPALLLSVLMRDRDTWQQLQQQQAEMLGLTEAALGVSQAANIELVEGQSKLIGLLERVAVAAESEEWFYVPHDCHHVCRKVEGDKLRKTILFDANTAADATHAVEMHNGTLKDVLPEIHTTLNQVTAIETSAEGRLQVAQQPNPDAPLVTNAVTCSICTSPADRYVNRFQCQANPGHVADLNTGIFSDLTPPL